MVSGSSLAHGRQREFRQHYEPQTSARPLVVTWATDINFPLATAEPQTQTRPLESAGTRDIIMASGSSTGYHIFVALGGITAQGHQHGPGCSKTTDSEMAPGRSRDQGHQHGLRQTYRAQTSTCPPVIAQVSDITTWFSLSPLHMHLSVPLPFSPLHCKSISLSGVGSCRTSLYIFCPHISKCKYSLPQVLVWLKASGL